MGLRGTALGDTDMDDHRRVAFSVFGHSHFLIPSSLRPKRIILKVLFFGLFSLVGFGGGGQLGAEGERQQAFRLSRPQSPCCRTSGGAVARLSVRDVLVMAPSSNAL